MDHHLAMVRATGLRSAMVGSEVGVGSWATGEYDEMEIAVSCPDGRGRALFRNVFSSSSLSILRIFVTISLHFGMRIWCGIIHL